VNTVNYFLYLCIIRTAQFTFYYVRSPKENQIR